jgi:hypothetical protein
MPAKTPAQRRLMCGVAHGSIKGKGIPKKVAREFCPPSKKKAKKK